MKSWWLVIALLLSVGVNLGVLAAVGANRWGRKPPKPPPEEQSQLPPPIAGETPQRAIRLADRLGLEGEQRRRFIARQGRFFVETVQLRTDMAETQRELRRELTAPQPDQARIDALLSDSARSFRALELAMAQNVVESRRLLNADQEKEFLQFVALLRPPGLGGGNPTGRRGGGGAQGPGPRQQRPPRGAAWEERPQDEAPEMQDGEPGEAPPGPPPPPRERWQDGQQGRMRQGENAAQPPFRPRRGRGPWWRRFGGGQRARPLPPVDGGPGSLGNAGTGSATTAVTISIQWPALAALAASLAVAQGLLFLLARGLGCRVSWKAAALCNVLAIVAVAPWLVRDRLMVPLDETILRNVPGSPAVADADPHGIYNDVILQLLPWEMEVRRALRSGRLPLWSDLLDGGSSPWVNPQTGVLSPVANLSRWAPLEHALLVALALKILIACQGAWLLARRLGAGRTAAAFGAGGAGLGGAIFPWGLFPLSSAAAFIPWVILAAVLLARRPTARQSAGGAIAFACLLLSGHPEVALAGTLLAAVCALGLKRRRTPWRRVIAGTAAGLLLGAGLAAPLLLPFLHILPETQRALRTLGKDPPPALADQASAEWFPGTAEQILLAPVNPWAFGHPFRETYTGPINWPVTGAGYAGLLAFAGVAAALFARRCWRRALPFLAFAVPSLLLAAAFRPLVRAAQLVPFLGAVAFDRFLPVAALALALAGALGLGEVLRRHRRPSIDLLVWAGPVLAAAASLVVRHDRRLLALWAMILLGLEASSS